MSIPQYTIESARNNPKEFQGRDWANRLKESAS